MGYVPGINDKNADHVINVLNQRGYESVARAWVKLYEEFKQSERADQNTRRCFDGNDLYFKKFEYFIDDILLFKGKNVLDIGGMCSLSAFFIKTIGGAKNVHVIDVGDWSTCAKFVDSHSRDSLGGIFYHQEQISNLHNLKIDFDAAYASDILYHLDNDVLDSLKENILNKCDVVVSHSRETKKKKSEKNKYSLNNYKGLATYLSEAGHEPIIFPRHTTKELYKIDEEVSMLRDKKLRRAYESANPGNAWVTVLSFKGYDFAKQALCNVPQDVYDLNGINLEKPK
tara:strand:+ start:2693 stop:3547 length:855 start_codon:yes stop_codon:yes gene_type:complete